MIFVRMGTYRKVNCTCTPPTPKKILYCLIIAHISSIVQSYLGWRISILFVINNYCIRIAYS